MKKSILVVVGTRPEAIKMAPVIKELSRHSCFDVRLCVTGQHKEMLDQVLKIFDLRPEYDLNVMKKNQSLSDLTSLMISKLSNICEELKPDFLFVHGDTVTTLSSAIVGYFNKIKVCHVEAGLRTHNLYAPWPEEGNRKLTAAISGLHFAPTLKAKENLISEGVLDKEIFVTGNTVIDALKIADNSISNNTKLQESLDRKYEINKKEKIVLVTCHRRENYGGGFEEICDSILELANDYKNLRFIFPVHLNPAVSDIVHKKLSKISNINLLEPLPYIDFVFLMKHSWLILTDSGGIQEEAPTFGTPVFVMREATERPEAVEGGTAKIVGSKKDDIVKEVRGLYDDIQKYKKMSNAKNPFGAGDASQKIVTVILNYISK
jgi:UDP-N-acetylglucosamine 2-epimerase (non-hydrolysing)